MACKLLFMPSESPVHHCYFSERSVRDLWLGLIRNTTADPWKWTDGRNYNNSITAVKVT